MATNFSGKKSDIFASQRRQQRVFHELCSIWVLRLVLSCQPDRRTLRRLMEDEAAEFLGIQDLVEDDAGLPLRDFSPRERKTILRSRLNKLESEPPKIADTCLGVNTGWVASKLRLSKAEQAVLTYAALLGHLRKFRNTLETVRFECTEGQTAEIIASILNIGLEKIRGALSENATLVQTGLVTLAVGDCEQVEDRLLISEDVCRILFQRHADAESLIEKFFKKAEPTRLQVENFAHLGADLQLIRSYLEAAGKRKTKGVNILLYGPPGVGKTEFARLIVQNSISTLFEVACADRQGGAIGGAARFSSFMLSQKLLANADSCVVLFDEIEDVFPSSSSGMLAMFLDGSEGAYSDSSGFGKAWINRVLENNPVPAIWITNRISQIDPAYLRRFDWAIEFSTPPKEARRRIAEKHLPGDLVGPAFLDRVAECKEITPGQVEKAAKVIRHLDLDREASEVFAERLLKHSAKVLGQPPLLPPQRHPTGYNLSFLNVNAQIIPLIDGLRLRPSGTFCFYGPAGTGKTALARHIAEGIGKPVMIRRASDLLGRFVGESEQNIAFMFEEAADSDAVLVLDEADSFLMDRRSARQSWEVTQVNELLTQMEAFRGVFICTTNLMERLDPASLRRFAFKVRFDYLSRDQRRLFFQSELVRLAPMGEPPTPSICCRLDQLDRLTPGDFAAVARQWALLGRQPDGEALIIALEEECRAKGEAIRAIGFSA